MGFTTGFVGGLTVTYTLAYLSLYVHRQNRIYQASLLHQQSTLLQSLYETPSQPYDEPAYEVRPVGLTEQLKDRWNRELASAIHNLQRTDWDAVRIRWENRAGNAWAKLRASETGEKVAEHVSAASESVVAGIGDAKGRAEEGLKEAQAKAAALAKDASREAERVAREAAEAAKRVAKDTSRKAQEAAREVKDKAVETKDAIVETAQGVREDAREIGREAKVKGKEVTGQKRLLEL